jgi:hypothetical protein
VVPQAAADVNDLVGVAREVLGAHLCLLLREPVREAVVGQRRSQDVVAPLVELCAQLPEGGGATAKARGKNDGLCGFATMRQQEGVRLGVEAEFGGTNSFNPLCCFRVVGGGIGAYGVSAEVVNKQHHEVSNP